MDYSDLGVGFQRRESSEGGQEKLVSRLPKTFTACIVGPQPPTAASSEREIPTNADIFGIDPEKRGAGWDS